MDERELRELFRDTARDAPPASFDARDVVQGSHRVTARRRVAAAGGSLAAAVVLVGGGVGFAGLWGVQEAPPLSQGGHQQPSGVEERDTRSSPGVLMQPQPDNASGCGSPDGQLVREMARTMPQAASAPAEAATDCPRDSRAVAFDVRDGASYGQLSVIVSPVGTADLGDKHDARRQQLTERTRSGKVLTVRSEAGNGSSDVPYGDRLPSLVGDLAPRF